ncbi:MAG: hypothetical protein OHK0029_41270 [Armatimonadaceae bacterium]
MGVILRFDIPIQTENGAIRLMGFSPDEVTANQHGSHRNYRVKALGKKGQFTISLGPPVEALAKQHAAMAKVAI